MKLNKKGFMMAEVVVVSSIVLVFLTSLYLSYNKLHTIYSSRVDYYDAPTLYKLAYYKDILIDYDLYDTQLQLAKNNEVSVIYDLNRVVSSISFPRDQVDNNTNDRVLMVYNNMNNLSDTILDKSGISSVNKTFTDYISFLSTSVDLTSNNYVMVMERCISQDECKYAYLEL